MKDNNNQNKRKLIHKKHSNQKMIKILKMLKLLKMMLLVCLINSKLKHLLVFQEEELKHKKLKFKLKLLNHPKYGLLLLKVIRLYKKE